MYETFESNDKKWIEKLESGLKSRIKKVLGSGKILPISTLLLDDVSFMQSLKIYKILFEIPKGENPRNARNIRKIWVKGQIILNNESHFVTIFPPDEKGVSLVIGI